MSTAAIIAGTTAAAGLGGAAISANAAGNAASTQANAADQAAQLEYQASQNALGFQENQWNTEQGELQPFLQAGDNGLANLQYLLGVGGNPTASTGTGQIPGGPSLPTGSSPTVASGSTGAPGTFGRPTASVATPAGSTQSLGNLTSLINRNGAPASNPTAIYSPSTSGVAGSQPVSPGVGPSSMPQPIAAGSTAGLSQFGSAMAPGSATPTGAAPSVPAVPAGAVPAGAANPNLGGYGSLMQSYPGGPFVAPTAAQALQSPAEQAQLQLGEQALQQSAAAQGNLLTGGTAEALDAYGQNVASTNYQNTYNNAYNTYASSYNQYQQQQTNEYNRLAALAGVGQTTASTLGTLGANASNNVSSNLLSTGQNIAQQTNNAAAANASGVVGAANAYGGALSSTGTNLSNLALLNQLTQGSTGAADASTAAGLQSGGEALGF